MYPVVRLAKHLWLARRAPPLAFLGTHVSHHRCWPQDIDLFMEMNNGRVLTILDLGRSALARRVGMLDAMRREGWGMTMAGVSVRYRKRIRPFVRFRTLSRGIGWDARFFYLDQTIWIDETCAAQALYRVALTDAQGLVAPERLARALGHDGPSPEMPAWVRNWIEADASRPWPPLVDALTPDLPAAQP